VNRNDNVVPFIIALCTIAIIVLYMLSKILIVFGVILFLFTFVLFFVGLHTENERFLICSVIILLIGISFVIVGNEGVEFFEENPTGRNLLDTANTVVNTTNDYIDKPNKIIDLNKTSIQKTSNQLQGV